MEQRIINPWKWQDRYGYSQAIEIIGGQYVLYCSGQASIDESGEPVYPNDMERQINKALDNLEIVLGQAGFGLLNVVRLNFYTPDIDGFMTHSEIVTRRLAQAGSHPSSTLLGITRLVFPELLIEIEATAVK